MATSANCSNCTRMSWLNEKIQGPLAVVFPLATSIKDTEKKKYVYGYIKLVLSLLLAVIIVENLLRRDFSRRTDVFGLNYFKEVLFRLVELVERIISK